ncbi:MAG: helix-turn-helix domain-containing protein, partial [Balneolaceae bacterium]
RLPNRLLALLMVVFSVDLGMAAFHSFGLHSSYPNLIGIDYALTLLYGPLLYLYVKTMKDGSATIKLFEFLHVVPFVFLLVYMVPFYVGPTAEKLMFVTQTQEISDTFGFGYINHFKVLHGLTYAGYLMFMLASYRRKLKDSFSSVENVNLSWLQNFVMATILLAAISGGLHFFGFNGDTVLMGLSDGIYDNITLLSVTVFVYGIGYMGLHQSAVFTEPIRLKRSNLSTEQYQKSGLTQKEASRCIGHLEMIMERQKLYRDSDLRLDDLADKAGISSHNLTEVLNRYMDQSFYDFVNYYRVEEVKHRIRDHGTNNLTLLALGYDAGFNSKSSFNSVFKKKTGMTPSEFRKKSIPEE